MLALFLHSCAITSENHKDVIIDAEIAFLKTQIDSLEGPIDLKSDSSISKEEMGVVFVSSLDLDFEKIKSIIKTKRVILKPSYGAKAEKVEIDYDKKHLVDLETGKRAVIIKITGARIEKDIVSLIYVYNECYFYTMKEYKLKKINEKWEVIEVRWLAIS